MKSASDLLCATEAITTAYCSCSGWHFNLPMKLLRTLTSWRKWFPSLRKVCWGRHLLLLFVSSCRQGREFSSYHWPFRSHQPIELNAIIYFIHMTVGEYCSKSVINTYICDLNLDRFVIKSCDEDIGGWALSWDV